MPSRKWDTGSNLFSLTSDDSALQRFMIPEKLSRSLRARGVVGTVRYGTASIKAMGRWYLDSIYDWRHRVDTSGKIQIADLSVKSENASAATWYEPVPNSCIRQLLRDLPIAFEQYDFIDVGSGKGRALFLAAECSFRKVVGVEFSPDLHAIALKNISSYWSRRRRCLQIESICQDAVEFDLPPVPSVLFFYSPFNAAVLSRILARVRESLVRSPRSLYILFVGVMPELIEALKTAGMDCREVRLRRDYLRGEIKRG